ncbi:MAG TPA: PQQ-binding-like beta-propeller repeat protein, partial [Nitrospiraceae bacterium]|nr:PQQ-binding-like beta-propeller repeat protein [Nitrospiraceae bacterium]
MSRVSPAIFEDELIFGDNVKSAVEHDGAHVMAVDRNSGKLLWITQVDAHPAAIITGSPVFSGTVVYVGVSSNEEALATNPSYKCCTFRGSVVALNAITGAILWKTFVVPENKGQSNSYSGGAVWQPPAIDPVRGLLFIGSGNNYTVPQSVLDCQRAAITAGNPDKVCTPADDHFDSAMAFDLKTGAIKWATGVMAFDAWTVSCLTSLTAINCPEPSGPDFDLGGSGPNLLANMVGFGQKSGTYWAMNPDTG